ncbi:MAG: DUF1838 domain-containing protein [Proteobacteria bacterium]|nr:DUF1838 domain-containing protein [Pseudomonadota bacterium]
MTSRRIFISAFLISVAAGLLPATGHAESTLVNSADFTKIRCNSSGRTTLTTWKGNVTTTGTASDKSSTLFKIAGFNVARCFRDNAGDLIVSSREMTFYLDPSTGEVLRNWQNPWNGESLPVVHIANALVQQKIPQATSLTAESSGETTILRIDVPLSYPNPLGKDPRFADYSPDSSYKAHESFSYVFSRRDLMNIQQLDEVKNVQVSWTRVSPWLPWMKMKGVSGQLVFNAIVQKHEDSAELPELFKGEIARSGTELYLDAPQCIVSNKPNVSSWTYFRDHFDAFLTKAVFPRPEPASLAQEECTAR